MPSLVQVVADNFDANNSSHNCQLSTHALAKLLMQMQGLSKNKMKESVFQDVPIKSFHGPPNSIMPVNETKRLTFTLKMLAHQCIT